jgi:hypothetical protein
LKQTNRGQDHGLGQKKIFFLPFRYLRDKRQPDSVFETTESAIGRISVEPESSDCAYHGQL